MYRTKTCGELRLADAGSRVTLAGWVQRARKMGGMTFVDMRDRYGITQVVFESDADPTLCDAANHLGREWVIQVTGKVAESFWHGLPLAASPSIMYGNRVTSG